MDLWKKAEIMSNLTGSDLESTYLGLQRDSINMNAPAPEWTPITPGHIDVKDILESARRAGVSDSSTYAELSKQTGSTFESLLIESQQIEMKPLHIDLPPSPLHRFHRETFTDLPHGGLALPVNVGAREIPGTSFVASQEAIQCDHNTGAEQLRIVLDFATSGNREERRRRREALEKLGEMGCSRELASIVRELMTSGDSDAREARRTALRMIGPSASEDLFALIMDYATSGDSDARETRRAALEKLGELGCRQELLGVVEKLVTAGDSDARETRRRAFEMLGSESAASLTRLVLDYATSGDSDARETRRAAIEKLGELGFRQELMGIVEMLVTARDSDARETRRRALEMLGVESAASLARLVLDYATSGDGDARETRRVALAKLGQFGCTEELIGIVNQFISSGDSDARETRRNALEMLGVDAARQLTELILNNATCSDKDVRETRRAALAALGKYGRSTELIQIAKALATSRDSDAREVLEMALSMA